MSFNSLLNIGVSTKVLHQPQSQAWSLLHPLSTFFSRSPGISWSSYSHCILKILLRLQSVPADTGSTSPKCMSQPPILSLFDFLPHLVCLQIFILHYVLSVNLRYCSATSVYKYWQVCHYNHKQGWISSWSQIFLILFCF